jgi:hypothetical protein
LPAAQLESSRASSPHRPRADGLPHPADTSRTDIGWGAAARRVGHSQAQSMQTTRALVLTTFAAVAKQSSRVRVLQHVQRRFHAPSTVPRRVTSAAVVVTARPPSSWSCRGTSSASACVHCDHDAAPPPPPPPLPPPPPPAALPLGGRPKPFGGGAPSGAVRTSMNLSAGSGHTVVTMSCPGRETRCIAVLTASEGCGDRRDAMRRLRGEPSGRLEQRRACSTAWHCVASHGKGYSTGMASRGRLGRGLKAGAVPPPV